MYAIDTNKDKVNTLCELNIKFIYLQLKPTGMNNSDVAVLAVPSYTLRAGDNLNASDLVSLS